MKSLLPTILITLLSFNTFGIEFWLPADLSRVKPEGLQVIKPLNYKSYRLDLDAFRQYFQGAPVLDDATLRSIGYKVSIPMPDGTFGEFSVYRNHVVPDALHARYPEIMTFSGQGITDPHATVVFDFTYYGFHAMVMTPSGNFFIDPVTMGDKYHYLVYFKRDFITDKEFRCTLEESSTVTPEINSGAEFRSVGSQLKTYRLAMAATGEYTAFHGGIVSLALSAIVTSVNRVSGIYERELAIRLTLIPNTDTLIFTNPNTDPYTNSNGGTMLGQNQTTVNAYSGGANYDIGHVFSTGGGGIAGLGVVCNFSNKARGVTGSSAPVGDPFDVDYVAHEIGHQYGGNHTFNAETGACSGNRAFTAAYEPGSGSTIMAYAGICSGNNLQSNSDDYFHTKSFDEIITYTTTGFGGTCPQVAPTGNTPPVINPVPTYVIPYLTPFRLTADAYDPDGDPLTYCWEQYNLGPAGTWNNPSGNAPIFRSFKPVTSPVRLFPKLSNILNNNQTIGEVKPAYARTLNFKLTVRDNRLNGGGVTNNDTTFQVQVINTGQAFAVTSPNTVGVVWTGGTTETVTWDVGGSDIAPVNTPLVNILLSTDGGQSFPVVLASQVPNNGSYDVQVPWVNTSTARIMVEGDGNIFFDINDKNFTIGIVGVQEYGSASYVSVQPNPAKGVFEVVYPSFNGGAEFYLTDAAGKLAGRFTITGSKTVIETTDIAPGLYFFRISDKRGSSRPGKIVLE